MNDRNKLVAPELPEGYFFRVKADKVNDVIVELRKKLWIGSRMVSRFDTARKSPDLPTVRHAMDWLQSSLTFLGDYQNKKVDR
jgi:hypothetical protein